MSDSLAALADALPLSVPTLLPDLIVSILSHLALSSRFSAAAISTEWRHAVQTPSLYACVGPPHVGKRVDAGTLRALAARYMSAATLELNLRSVLCLSSPLVVQLVSAAPQLRSLDLSACDVDDAALEAVGSHCAHLRSVGLWMNDELTDAGVAALAAGCPELRDVDLRSCAEVTEQGVVALAGACAELLSLRLKGVGLVGDAALGALGAGCPRLETLDVSGSVCGDPGVQALAAGCRALRQLFLAGCKRVTDAGVTALAARCAALRLLDLQGCSTVGDAAALQLAANCPALDTVSFQCCPGLSDAGFRALCERCPLKHCTLKHCAVTDGAIAAAEQAYPQLRVRCVESGKSL